MPTAEQVEALREKTGRGLMDCKAFLEHKEREERLLALYARILEHSQHDPVAAIVEELIAMAMADVAAKIKTARF